MKKVQSDGKGEKLGWSPTRWDMWCMLLTLLSQGSLLIVCCAKLATLFALRCQRGPKPTAHHRANQLGCMALNIYIMIQTKKNGKVRNMVFDVFGVVSKLRACNAGVIASGVVFYVGKSIFWTKTVRRGLGSPKLMYSWKNGLMEMYLGVFGVYCIISCYVQCFYEIQCNFAYIRIYVKEFSKHFWK